MCTWIPSSFDCTSRSTRGTLSWWIMQVETLKSCGGCSSIFRCQRSYQNSKEASPFKVFQTRELLEARKSYFGNPRKVQCSIFCILHMMASTPPAKVSTPWNLQNCSVKKVSTPPVQVSTPLQQGCLKSFVLRPICVETLLKPSWTLKHLINGKIIGLGGLFSSKSIQ